jgi:hypothetical protein
MIDRSMTLEWFLQDGREKNGGRRRTSSSSFSSNNFFSINVCMILLVVLVFTQYIGGTEARRNIYVLTQEIETLNVYMFGFHGDDGTLFSTKLVGYFSASTSTSPASSSLVRAIFDTVRQNFIVLNATDGVFAPLQQTISVIPLNGTISVTNLISERGHLFEALAINSFETYRRLLAISKNKLFSIDPDTGLVDEKWSIEPSVPSPPSLLLPTLITADLKNFDFYFVAGSNRSDICFFNLHSNQRHSSECSYYTSSSPPTSPSLSSSIHSKTLDLIPSTPILIVLSSDGQLWKINTQKQEANPILEFPKKSSLVGGSYYDPKTSLLFNLWNSTQEFGFASPLTLTITSQLSSASVYDPPVVEEEVTLHFGTNSRVRLVDSFSSPSTTRSEGEGQGESYGSEREGEVIHVLLGFGIVEENSVVHWRIQGIPVIAWMTMGGLCTLLIVIAVLCCYCCTKKTAILSV